MKVELGGVPISLISLGDFRMNRIAAGRTRDRADLEALGDPPATDAGIA
ncbi:MAG TPA: hypothetical protein VH328_09680 [Burkholderiaceae bacterium]|nr:hypothetical protein [Burkholderiaceae bacterium]